MLFNKIKQHAPDERSAGIIAALTLNMTNQISQDEWDLFRRTGTTHLFGISGEHIAIIAVWFLPSCIGYGEKAVGVVYMCQHWLLAEFQVY